MNSVKLQDTKINIQKQVAFVYFNRLLPTIVIFAITSKRIKYLGIKLIKEVKNLNSENYKTLMKAIEEDTNKWEGILCS